MAGKGIVKAATVSGGGSPPTALNDFTIGTLDYQWRTGPVGLQGKRTLILRIIVPVTPPGLLGAITAGHIYTELPDQSAAPSARMDGTTLMNGAATMQGPWAPVDQGIFPYKTGQSPWYFDIEDPHIQTTTIIRVYVASYSDQLDKKLIQYGLAGATPSATISVDPFAAAKPGSGSNATHLLVTSMTATALATQMVPGSCCA